MSELQLKKPVRKTKKLVGVRTLNDVVFFGLNGTQLSSGMPGIRLEWDGAAVIVTSESFPSEERWILPANIATMTWREE